MSLGHGPSIVTDNLSLYLDAANPKSYGNGSPSFWHDISGHSYDGVLYGGPVYSTYNNGYLVFRAAEYLTGSKSIPAVGSNASIEALIYLNSGAGTTTIFGQGQSGSAFSHGMIIQSNQLKFRNTTSNYLLQSGTLTDGAWYHLVITSDGSNSYGYVNGQYVGQTANTITSCSYPQYTIGCRAYNSTASELFDGFIAYVRVYNKTLTSNEVIQNYQASDGRVRNPIIWAPTL